MNDQFVTQEQEEQTRPRAFRPQEHLIQIKGRDGAKDYLPVKWRLVWFRETYPHGTINTQELEVDLDREVEEVVMVWNSEKRRSERVVRHAKGYARYKAVVTDGCGGCAEGTKSENAASFADFIEKAETGAIGRALAALGFGTQFSPDLEEAHRIVDSPVERSTPVLSSANGQHPAAVQALPSGDSARPSASAEDDNTATATEQQLASIRKLSEHLGKQMPEDGSLTFLTARQVIQQLTAEYRVARKKNQAS